MLKKSYFPEIDILKGLTILLVVLGHCFCTRPINLFEDLPVLGNVVRSFQMPLFFLVSGFLFSWGGWKILLAKKTRRLLIPYVAFGILTILLRYVFSSFTNGGEISMGTSLVKLLNGEYYWFLYTLILIMLAFQIIGNKIVIVSASIVLVALCLLTEVRTISFMTLGRFVYYMPFFALGFSWKGTYVRFWEMFEKYKLFIIPLLLILVSSSFLIPEYADLLGVIHLYIRPMLGILTTWILAREISKSNLKSNRVFAHFGRYSLQYYLNHLLIMLPFYKLAGYLSNMNPLVPLMLIFICAVITSYVMLIIEKRFSITRMLCGLK